MMMKKMCGVHKVAWVLLMVGGLNWLLVGVLKSDLFVLLGIGMDSIPARAAYLLVGLSAVSMLGLKKCCMKNGCQCGAQCDKTSTKSCDCSSGKKPEDCCMKNPAAHQ